MSRRRRGGRRDPRSCLVGGLLAIVLVVGACSSDDRIDSATASTTTEPIEFARPSVDAVTDSIVRIIAFGCGAPALGSGFAVSPDLIVTSGHLVTGRDPETLAVLRPSGEELRATLVAFDADLDLAALHVDGADFDPVDLLAEVPLESGVAIGMRTRSGVSVINEVEFRVDAPVIVNWDGVFRDTESQFRGIRLEAEIRRGDSGSPLFVNDDAVIGLIHSTNRNGLPRGYAVSSEQISMFLEEVDPTTEIVADRCT